jgi:hypothetical protein
MHHVDKVVAEAFANPGKVAEVMTRRACATPVVCDPIGLEKAVCDLRSRPGAGYIQGTRIDGTDTALTREEEEKYFTAYTWARQQLRDMYAVTPDWRQVVDDDWGCVLFDRSVWMRQMLWQFNWPLYIGWFAKNKNACAHLVTQDDDDLMILAGAKMLDCVDLFDPTKGRKFSTYCVNSLDVSVRTQSKREQLRGRNTVCQSIFVDDERKTYCAHADPKCADHPLRQMSVSEKVDWINVHGDGLPSEIKEYLIALVQGCMISTIDPADVLRTIRKSIRRGEFPTPD